MNGYPLRSRAKPRFDSIDNSNKDRISKQIAKPERSLSASQCCSKGLRKTNEFLESASMLPFTSKTKRASDTIVFMGVCGCGKSAVAQAFAQRTNWDYLDADDYHTPENVSKMASGEPLTDADRAPWLENLNTLLIAAQGENRRTALACSALKKRYRDLLRANGLSIQFILLDGSRELLLSRLGDRSDHFMPSTLLDRPGVPSTP